MSITRAQAEAIRDGFLNNVGSTTPDGTLAIVEEVLTQTAGSFILTASANLDRADAVNTGELSTEMEFTVTQSPGLYVMSIGYERGSKGEKYYDFVNKGVKGVSKPGKGGNSPYKFRYKGVSPAHAKSIEAWLRNSGKSIRNVSPKHPASGLERKKLSLSQSLSQEDKIKSAAYAIARSNKIHGLKPTHYFDDAIRDTLGPDFIESLKVALGGEVILAIRQVQKEIKK